MFTFCATDSFEFHPPPHHHHEGPNSPSNFHMWSDQQNVIVFIFASGGNEDTRELPNTLCLYVVQGLNSYAFKDFMKIRFQSQM